MPRPGSRPARRVTRSGVERLSGLTRSDKWYLSAGDGWIWAPPFPRWLNRPGFWDAAHYRHFGFAPLFGVALVDPRGDELALTLEAREWRPDRMTATWRATSGDRWVEERFVLPGGRFCSAWRAVGRRATGAGQAVADAGADPWAQAARASDAEGGPVHLVAFTAQPDRATYSFSRRADGLRWRRTLVDRFDESLVVRVRLGAGRRADEETESPSPAVVAVARSEGSPRGPDWRHTPFREAWPRLVSGSCAGEEAPASDGGEGPGSVFGVVGVKPRSAQDLLFCLQFAPADEGPGRRAPAAASPPTGTHGETAGSTSASPPAGAEPTPVGDAAVSTGRWADFFDRFPAFECGDPYLERYFDYRIYGLFLNRLEASGDGWRYPAIAEGIEYFHQPISYSAPCHAFEMRWARQAAEARGSVLNFLDHQDPQGRLPGRLLGGGRSADFYHANWGDAVLAVQAVDPDDGFLRAAYRGLSRYARWLDSDRDREGSGLYDVVNHFETGQEYTSRYLAVCADADRRGWRGGFRLKGIDATVYAYLLKRALATVARSLGDATAERAWSEEAGRIGTALLESMWDEERGLFSDVDPGSGSRTGVKAAVCFYPLLTDLLSKETVTRLLGHLRDRGEFASPFPVPSSSLDDPRFHAEGRWRNRRRNCPWNGRVWPMTNSHVLEGLLRQWIAGRREVGPTAVELLRRFVRMLFRGGDPERPACFEHYNPLTGHASTYRGIDDYQHSWILDLLVRAVAGLHPTARGLRVDPLPMPVDRVILGRATVRKRRVDLERQGDRIGLRVDGLRYETEVGAPLEIELPPGGAG